MSNVVDITSRQPHMSGPARCLSCKHTWEAVTPVGVYDSIPCPACELHKGELTANIVPPDDANVWTCRCGNDLFFVHEDCIQCRLCGVSTLFDELL